MKVEITCAQLEAIKSMTDEVSAMCGGGGDDADWRRYIMLVDRMLKKNSLSPRDFT